MTNQEAIELIKTTRFGVCEDCVTTGCINCRYITAKVMAIDALEEQERKKEYEID